MSDPRHYYNEIEPYAVAWLRNLMAEGLIPAGDIDTRSIEDVRPIDLAGYVQCHFFAGIGGWPLALALAGWPVDRPVWTGSCPCQPFSKAGAGNGFDDQRHLWPTWQHLIAQCQPSVVFGEQVASSGADPWVDLVQSDLEGLDYAFGCVPIPAAGIRAPHIRERHFWVADTDDAGLAGRKLLSECRSEWATGQSGLVGGLANANSQPGEQRGPVNGWSYTRGDAKSRPGLGGDGGIDTSRSGPLDGFWRNADWIACLDGKWRPVEPGTFPLAHGVSGRVGRLRAYGNAIVPQVAAAFIQAYTEARGLMKGNMELAA